jgi:hypothetical protein
MLMGGGFGGRGVERVGLMGMRGVGGWGFGVGGWGCGVRLQIRKGGEDMGVEAETGSAYGLGGDGSTGKSQKEARQ